MQEVGGSIPPGSTKDLKDLRLGRNLLARFGVTHGVTANGNWPANRFGRYSIASDSSGADVESALALLRLALERGWTLGLLFVLFCGAAMTAPRLGFALPGSVTEWSAAGLLFGAAVIVVSLAANSVAAIRRKLGQFAERRADLAEQEARGRQALANVSALSTDQAETFLTVLRSGAARFQVDIVDDRYPLLELGLLNVVHDMGNRLVCELHPAIAARRDEFINHFQETLDRFYQR
jgi:hypothetical protein